MAQPQVRLLDARDAGLDDTGLRALARAQTADAPHSARSYRFPYALIASHSEPVGVDIERVEPVDDAFADSICTPAERHDLGEVEDRDHYFTSLWCSKEALAKALGDALAYDPRRLESPMHWREGESGPWRARELNVAPGHVAWLCWRSSAIR